MAAISALRKFVAPEFVFGAGSRLLAGQYARNLGARRVLLVSDAGVIAAGWTGQVAANLEQNGLPHVLFADVSPNPRAEQIMAGAQVFAEQRCNLLVAVGGGSVIDCAKGIGIVHSNGGHILGYSGIDQVLQPMPPLICIPTTAGTAADISQFAVVTDRQRRSKIAIISKAVVPDLALIDPETTTSMDPFLTACTGLDALTHAVEAFVSRASSPITDLHALQAIRKISDHLLPAVQQPHDLQRRTAIMLASLHAGLAFSNAILGATHAMAHSLGGLHDLPHGLCNAIVLDRVVEFNFLAAPERFERIAHELGMDLRSLTLNERKAALVKRFRALRQSVGLSPALRPLGVGSDDVPRLGKMAMQDPCMITNPRQPNKRDIEVLYEEAL
jgi:alcohol dehydrogenase